MISVDTLKICSQDHKIVEFSFKITNSLGLVGESGSGKSLTLKALLGMLPKELEVDFRYTCDFDLIAGKTVAFVPQNPFTALSPLTKIKKQFYSHKDNVKHLITMVGLHADVLEKFPSELSGGQLQRVVLAIALENNPKLLLLDEITTALDTVSTQQVLELLQKLQREKKFFILFVTHDISSVAKICDTICVIKDGIKIEYGDLKEILKHPKELYTKMLIEANFKNRNFRK